MIRLLAVLALIACSQVHAQTMVLACKDAWGAADNCGGCSGLIWSAPDVNDKVKTTDRSKSSFQFWTRLGDLPATAPVSVGTGAEGATASCSAVTGTKTVGELLGATPAPPTTEPPTTGAGSATLNWSAPATNTDGSALTNLTGYRIDYWQGSGQPQAVTVGSTVRTYTLTGLAAGSWAATVTTLAGTAQSAPSNQLAFMVTASAPPPPPPPPPVSKWVVASVSSNSRPVYEAVLNASGNALVRGNSEGQIASGKPCGDQVFAVSRNSYRTITESDATLDSPTYKGRKHVAICTLAP